MKNGEYVLECLWCGGEFREVSPYVDDNPYFGHIELEIEEHGFARCTNCGHVLESYALSQKVTAEYLRRIKAFLLEKHNPETHRDEYYTAEEATKLLKEKRQLDDERYEYLLFRIRHNGELLFLKESVDKMKKYRDDEEAGRETDHSYGMLKIF